MKVKDFSNHRYAPIILGDIAQVPRVMPKLSEEELLAMQPASTQRILKGEVKANRPLVTKEECKAKEPDIEKRFNDDGLLIYMRVDDHVYTQVELDSVIWINENKDKIKENRIKALAEGAYYRVDKTSLIRADNTTGDIPKPCTPEWKKNFVKKIAEPSHPRFVEFKQPKEDWTEVSWGKAFIHWLKGDKVRKINE